MCDKVMSLSCATKIMHPLQLERCKKNKENKRKQIVVYMLPWGFIMSKTTFNKFGASYCPQSSQSSYSPNCIICVLGVCLDVICGLCLDITQTFNKVDMAIYRSFLAQVFFLLQKTIIDNAVWVYICIYLIYLEQMDMFGMLFVQKIPDCTSINFPHECFFLTFMRIYNRILLRIELWFWL